MASTTYIDGTTVIYAAWLNDVNTVTYKGFTGYLSIATAITYADTGLLGQFASNTAGYNQFVIQNTNSGSASSSSFLASNDAGTANTNYVEMGINSSTFTGSGSFNQAGYSYLASATTDLAIGTYGSNGIHFTVNSGATDAMAISSTGFVTFPQAGGLTLPANATATTQASTDNSTKVATTAFVTTAVSQSPAPLQSIGASVASNALTVNYNGGPLAFRNATLTTGTPVNIQVGALSLVVPSSATLGTVNATQAQLALVVLYNAGTPALGIVNMAGGVNLDETTLLSTTAISAAATANNVVYSTAGITNSPFRVVGYINITEATAGTWATAPSLVQGYGGQAMAAMQSLGFGQTWQNVTRASGTTYYNTTSRPIILRVQAVSSAAGQSAITFSVNSYLLPSSTFYFAASGYQHTADVLVPPGASYSLLLGGGNLPTLGQCAELR